MKKHSKKQKKDAEDKAKAQQQQQQKASADTLMIKKAQEMLDEIKINPSSYTGNQVLEAAVISSTMGDKVHQIYYQALVEKKKAAVVEQHDVFHMYETKSEINAQLKKSKENAKFYKDKGDKKNELKFQAEVDALNAFSKEKEEAEKKAKEDAKKVMSQTGTAKVSVGREVRFGTGVPVKRDEMYLDLTLEELEKLSSQVKGHALFEATNRRDILGRDRVTARNHHMGHDVRIKSGLKGEDKELAKAFALAYDEYFNTIKCQPINLAYLDGYENASAAMKKKIDAINMCIQSVELSEPVNLHRFVDGNIVEAIFKTTDVQSIDVGTVFENNTFMSTATGGHPTFGKRPYMITLQCDKGTHALPTLNHEELEVLLGKGKLEFVTTNKHTSKKPRVLKNFDGTDTNFVGEEIVVRYIEEGKAQDYEKPTTSKIDSMLDSQRPGKETLTHHTQYEHSRWLGTLSSSEKSSTVKYTGSYYTTMNGVLRQRQYGTGSNTTAEKHIENTQKALRKASTDKPVVLKRGMGIDGLSYILGGDGTRAWVDKHLDKINKGDYVCEDKGFLSMTQEEGGGFGGEVEVRMYCPAGTRAAYVAPISNFKSEKETLLQSGSVSRVVKIEKN